MSATPKLTMAEEILYLISEEPGITAQKIGSFFSSSNSASAQLSTLYAKGLVRREPVPRKGPSGRQTYRYWLQDGRPEPRPEHRKSTRRDTPTEAGWRARCEELERALAELQNWKHAACVRYPDLCVPEIVLRARKIAAKANPDFADALLAGKKDQTPIMLAVITALEESE